jgi:hypothetical protein
MYSSSAKDVVELDEDIVAVAQLMADSLIESAGRDPATPGR